MLPMHVNMSVLIMTEWQWRRGLYPII